MKKHRVGELYKERWNMKLLCKNILVVINISQTNVLWYNTIIIYDIAHKVLILKIADPNITCCFNKDCMFVLTHRFLNLIHYFQSMIYNVGISLFWEWNIKTQCIYLYTFKICMSFHGKKRKTRENCFWFGSFGLF